MVSFVYMLAEIFIEGLIYGIMVLGLFCTFRVLNFCDMTVDGSFPLGACVLAACLLAKIPMPLALCVSFFSGLVAGLVTSAIYTRLHIPDLLAGILTMTMLYSINLRIMGNKSNVSFLRIPTLFSNILDIIYEHIPSVENPEWGIVAFLILFVLILKIILDLFFHTDMGLTMGALGSNPQLVVSQGVNPTALRTIGICFGNGLAALAGAFAAMYNGFADVGMGTGIVVSGLASLMLGEFVIHSNKIGFQTLRVLIGSCMYRALMILARTYGHLIRLTPNDLKLVTGILIILCLIVSRFKLSEKLHVTTKKQPYSSSKTKTK